MGAVGQSVQVRGDRQMVLMFTDVVDSVAIKRQIGDVAYVTALQAHLARLTAAILAEPGASVIKSTGDGVLARFATPGDAVRAALRIQAGGSGSQLSSSGLGGTKGGVVVLPDRIGIHAGVGIETTDPNGNADVAGLAVDMAARVMGLCEPGQILLTRAAFDDARQFVREHPGGGGRLPFGPSSPQVLGTELEDSPRSQNLASGTREAGGVDTLSGVVGEGTHPPVIRWMAHGPYLFKGSDEALEVFEVGGQGVAPLKAPRDSEKARRAVTPGEEGMYDWRPAVGLDLPRRANWVLDRKLGEGGFGEVWLAKQRKTGDKRVFKFCFDADRLRSFRRELTLFRLLREALGDRKDIARIFDVSLEHPPFFLESEYSSGGDLYDWSAGRGGIGTIPLMTRLDMLRRISEAVAAAHSVGVLHKDLKPSNVLMEVSEDGSPRPKLADFGIGILADRSRLDGAGFTIAGFTAAGLTMNDSSRTGTRLYSPPESMINVRTTDGGVPMAAPFTAKGDVYALGVMLYQFVIGDLDRPLAIGWERNVEAALGQGKLGAMVGEAPSQEVDRSVHPPEMVGEGSHPPTMVGEGSHPPKMVGEGPSQEVDRSVHPPKMVGEGTHSPKMVGEGTHPPKMVGEGTHPPSTFLREVLTRDIAEMVEGDPDRRMASAAEVARRLGTVPERVAQLEREAIAAQAAEEANQRAALAEGRRRKTRAVSLVVVSVLVILLGVGALALSQVSSARDEAMTQRDVAEAQRAEAVAARKDAEAQRAAAMLSMEAEKAAKAEAERERSEAMAAKTRAETALRQLDEEEYYRLTLDRFAKGISLDEVNSIVGSPRVGARHRDELELRRALAKLYSPLQRVISPGAGSANSVAINRAGTLIAGSFADHSIRLFDVESGAQIGESLLGHTEVIDGLSFSPDGDRLVSCSLDYTIRLWDLRTRQLIGAPWQGHTSRVRVVKFSPDGRLVASGSSDDTIRLWDPASGSAIGQPMRGHLNGVTTLSFDGDGSRLVSGGLDQMMWLWDVKAQKPIANWTVPLISYIWSVAFSPDGNTVVAGTSSSQLMHWDVSAMRPTGIPTTTPPTTPIAPPQTNKFLAHRSAVYAVATHPISGVVASASVDGQIMLWDLATERLVGAPYLGHIGCIWSVAFSDDGRYLVSCSEDGTIRVWNTLAAKPTGPHLNGPTRSIVSYALDDRVIVAGCSDGSFIMWDAATGELARPIAGDASYGATAAVSRDGRMIACVTAEDEIVVSDIESGKRLATISGGHSDITDSLAFNHDGTMLASGAYDGTLRLWNPRTGESIGERIPPFGGAVGSIDFNSDGSMIAVGCFDNTISLWDSKTQKRVGNVMSGHSRVIFAVKFSNDGTRVASASADRTVSIWDVKTQTKSVPSFDASSKEIYSLAFSPCDRILASGCQAGAIHLWNPSTGKQLGPEILYNQDMVFSLNFSKTGQELVSSSQEGKVYRWRMPVLSDYARRGD